MKKIFIILLVACLSSCSSKECSNFKGCKYKVVNNLFSNNTEIIINGSYSIIDLYIIIIDEIIDNTDGKALKITITDTNIKYLSKEDVSYIKERATKISEYDNLFTAMGKATLVSDRISNYKQ